MFSCPRPNLYVSSEGYSVEVLGRTGLRYREGERAMRVDAEVVTGPSGLLVYRSTIRRWEPPHAAEPIDAAGQARILENIRAAFRDRGFEIDAI